MECARILGCAEFSPLWCSLVLFHPGRKKPVRIEMLATGSLVLADFSKFRNLWGCFKWLPCCPAGSWSYHFEVSLPRCTRLWTFFSVIAVEVLMLVTIVIEMVAKPSYFWIVNGGYQYSRAHFLVYALQHRPSCLITPHIPDLHFTATPATSCCPTDLLMVSVVWLSMMNKAKLQTQMQKSCGERSTVNCHSAFTLWRSLTVASCMHCLC